MGTKAKQIINLNVDELISLLNKALADEWLAYYQYWIGAQIAKGPMRPAIVAELAEHAKEELEHADKLVKRIVQLGGQPNLDPNEFTKLANCSYLKPTDLHVKAILQQNIKGEQCAIEVYKKLLDFTNNKDELTYNLLLSILEDEVEHEEDLEALLEDLSKI